MLLVGHRKTFRLAFACLALICFSSISLASSPAVASPSAVRQQDQDLPPATEKLNTGGAQDPQSQSDVESDDSTEQVTGDKGGQDNTVLGVDLDAISNFAQRMRGARKVSRMSPEIVDLMSPVVASISPSTVRVYSGEKQLAIGTVVDANGLILTVADELKLPMTCRLPDGSTREASVFGIDQETGLALLKVEAANLNPINMSHVISPQVGDWLASASPDHNPISIGIVSVLERKISGGGAFIGITMDDDENGVRILSVVTDSPADDADLWINDVITKIDNKKVDDRMALIEMMRNYSPGDEVEITVQRQGKELAFNLILAPRNKFDEDRNQQDRMGSVLSKRRQGFSLAFQHDSFLQANECGSPVVDLDGNVVGINIARSGRVSSLALPLQIVLPAVERLKSGGLAPAIINARRIEQVEAELERLAAENTELPEQLKSSQAALEQDKIRLEELKNTQRMLEERQKQLAAETMANEEKLKALESQMKENQSRRERLMRELDELKAGAR